MEPLWLVDEDADDDIAAQLQLDGESLSPTGWNTIPELLYNGWLRWWNSMQAGNSVQASP